MYLEKNQGGLRLRKLHLLNKALLSKWICKFVESDCIWKRMVKAKYGTKEFGWRTKEARGTFGAGISKDLLKDSFLGYLK